MIDQREVTTTVDVVVSDATGEDLEPSSGFAIVRLRDDVVLAHFQHLDDLSDPLLGRRLRNAAFGEAQRNTLVRDRARARNAAFEGA